jgi:hypothetical protein
MKNYPNFGIFGQTVPAAGLRSWIHQRMIRLVDQIRENKHPENLPLLEGEHLGLESVLREFLGDKDTKEQTG